MDTPLHQLEYDRVTPLLGGGLRTTAPAKINLNLHITGKRSDGYHLIESLFAFTHSGDVLEAHPARGFHLSISGPFASDLRAFDVADNLVLKAAHALADAIEAETGVKIVGAALKLTKNLPVASGIGGGSMDAAAALRLLRRLWGVPVTREAVHSVAASLGADVASGLYQGPLWVTGVGDAVRPCDIEFAKHCVLVNPGVAVETGPVFRALSAQLAAGWQFDSADTRMQPRFDKAWLAGSHNSLQVPAINSQPAIQDVLTHLEAQDGAFCVRMSGSGATCFALFEAPHLADKAAMCLKAAQPGWWVERTGLRGQGMQAGVL